MPLFPTVDSHDQLPDLRVPPPPAPRRLTPGIILAGRQESTPSSLYSAVHLSSGHIFPPPRPPNPLRPRPAQQHKAFAALLPIIADEATEPTSDITYQLSLRPSTIELEESDTTLADTPVTRLKIDIPEEVVTPPTIESNAIAGDETRRVLRQ